MARKDALLKLHSRLVSRRKELTGTIEEQLGALRLDQGNSYGDELDVAAISMNSELTSQLAEHESRELANIERAMLRLREGVYGNCEVCDKKIPIERLNALPYTTVCVICQRELETNPELREELENRHEREAAGHNDDDEYEDGEEREQQESEEEESEEPPRRVRRRGAPSKPTPVIQAKPVATNTVAAKPVAAKVATKPVITKPALAKAAMAKAALAKATLAKSSKSSSSKVSASKSSAKPVAKAPVKPTAAKNGKHTKAKAGSRSR